ncbi:MAG: prephenate dehydrogenase, partial [Clostridia bacterium]|nr:prephenate dehydrogenase [Clostridia bacterium]
TTVFSPDFFKSCDILFLCAPVISISKLLEQLRNHIPNHCIITDVGSVKGFIAESIAMLNLSSHYIGGHPMAGSERSGYEHASERLFENAYYVLSPSPASKAEDLALMKQLVASIGALPIVLPAPLHDHATGVISHLPHIIAASLVQFLKQQDTADELMKTLAAGGFKDITRIASSSPAMWKDICLTNESELYDLLDQFTDYLSEVKQIIRQKNEPKLIHFFEEARDYRNSMTDHKQGSITRVFALYCDIPDETGIIATIATILAEHKISIKNIGIINNREFEDGVLRIEFYDADSVEQAAILLRKREYIICKQL